MAPEQLLGKMADAHTDLFSLGVVMYELLTGRLPFDRDSPGAIVHAILNQEPEDLRSVRPEVPQEVAAVVAKALQKDREKRYGSAREILADLKAIQRQYLPAEARPPSPAAKPRRGVGLWAGAIGAALVCTVIALSALWWHHRPHSSGPPIAAATVTSQAHPLAGAGVPSFAAKDSTAKPSIAVLPFSNLNKDPTYSHLEGGIADALEESLGGTGQFRLVERAQLDKTLNELNLNRSEYVDPATAQRVGHLIGAQYLAIGSFQVWQGEVRLNARLIRVETGEIVAVDKVVGPAGEALRLPDQLAAKFLHALPQEVTGAKP
jgi:serine/threonine protein kinase